MNSEGFEVLSQESELQKPSCYFFTAQSAMRGVLKTLRREQFIPSAVGRNRRKIK